METNLKSRVILLLILCAIKTSAQNNIEEINTHRTAIKIDSLLSGYNETEPGVAIGLVQKNELIYEKYFGMANLDYEIPIHKGTSFHVASVSKQFTAFAILLLEDEGKLSLEDDIRIYLPEMHKFEPKITISHLLNHTSGLKDKYNLLRLSGWTLNDVITNEQVLELIFNQESLNFKPNEKHMYSNANYALLAEIVARVSKMSFAEFTHQRIFEPLQMEDSKFVDQEGQVVKNKSLSYYKVDSIYVEDLFNNFSVGATNLNTTITDLSKWAINYDTKKVGSEAIFNKMQTLKHLNNGETYGYANGLFINTYEGFKRIEHSGQDASYQAYLATFPELNLSVIFTNINGEINGARMVYDIMDICLEQYVGNEATKKPTEEKLTHQKPISKTPAELRRYEGHYWDEGDSYSREIKVENDTLRFITKNGTTTLVPVDEHAFELDIDDYVGISFANNQMIITLDDGYQIYTEKYVPAHYTATTLEEFTGRYYSSELNAYYSFYIEEDQLIAKHTRLGNFPLKAIKNDYFIGNKGSFLKVVIVRNSSNDVRGFEVSSSRAKNVLFTKLKS
ncbi:serine hydrolase [Maribacter sp. PR1]|uniref:Serine hydrolase domain-containing protein n=1 Tax=Maribacter cobaltidurans TaxID=1178778 RepID=A0ABU7ITQ9_9FLAO|nr:MULTISPECIES: serine hydrolase domain-containing protein [Maribacter]MDC6388982.1 serine hydrolase [Maribacter sp. PR1]MEE1976370.1 serine hydrolase domain-containing protein [Maribacter cobaltidurans]